MPMRARITLRLDAKLLRAARERAAADNRRLENYIEVLIQHDLGMAPKLEVIAPDRIEEHEPVPFPGETRAERRFRDALFHAILKAGTRPAAKR